MRLLTFEYRGQRRIGARSGRTIVDLNLANQKIPRDMRSFLKAGPDAITAAQSALKNGEPSFETDQISICAPIINPEKIICIGLNYADHAIESKMPIPSEPVVFSKFTSSIIGTGMPILLPSVTQKVDYEVELVAIIGTSGRNISEKDALNHIVGYTIGHDVSARDYQLEKPGGQWLLGKTFDTFAPIGPEIVTSDEISDPHNLGIRSFLNNQKVQDSCTKQLIFKVGELVAYLSKTFTLKPGDLIFTGTPSGVGMGRNPQIWLKHGDTVLCEIDELGRLENSIISEKN